MSNQLVRDRMEKEDVQILESIKDTDIVCVRGTYDHIHLVLEAIEIPFAHVSPANLLTLELSPEQTIYINCPSDFPREAALKLERFVSEGGQLITTDWALKHVLEVAFPNTVKFNGNSTGDEVVAVEIVDKEDEVLKGSTLENCMLGCVAASTSLWVYIAIYFRLVVGVSIAYRQPLAKTPLFYPPYLRYTVHRSTVATIGE